MKIFYSVVTNPGNDLKRTRSSSPVAGNFRRVSRLGENTGGVQLFLTGDISAKVPMLTPDVLKFNDFFGTERGNVTSTACGRKVTALPRMSCLSAPSCALSLGTHLAQKFRAVNLIRVFAFVRCALRLD